MASTSLWSSLRALIFSTDFKEVLKIITNKDVILFVGNVYNGKSTAVNYVLGNKLQNVGYFLLSELKKSDDSIGPPIRNRFFSGTTIPTVWKTKDLEEIIVDTPGFSESEVQDIANAYYLNKIIRKVKSVKFVLVVGVHDVSYTAIVDEWLGMWSTCPYFPLCTTLLYTRGGDTLTTDKLQEMLLNKLDGELNNYKNYRNLAEYISKNPNQISVLPLSGASGDYSDQFRGPIIKAIKESSRRLSAEQLHQVKPTISNDSQLLLMRIIQTIKKEFCIPAMKAFRVQLEKILQNMICDGTVENIAYHRNIILSYRDRIVAIQAQDLSPVGILKQLYEILPEVSAFGKDSDSYNALEFLTFVESLGNDSLQKFSEDMKRLMKNLIHLCSTRETEILYETGVVVGWECLSETYDDAIQTSPAQPSHNSSPPAMPINSSWTLLKTLIFSKDFKDFLNKIDNKDVILFVGDTKSGKSTSLNYIIGNKLEAFKVDIKIQIRKVDNSFGPPIGVSSVSETTIPTLWKSRDLNELIVDTPGFGDNRGEIQDIANAFYLKELVGRAKSVKFVLVMDVMDILADNISSFTTTVDKCFAMWSACPDFPKSTILLFTKDSDDLNGEIVRKMLTEKIIVQTRINLKNRDFVKHICDNTNQICFLPRPKEIGMFSEHYHKPIIEAITKCSQSMTPEQLLNVKPGISDKSKVLLLTNIENIYEQSCFPQVVRECSVQMSSILQQIQWDGTAKDIANHRNTILSYRDKIVAMQAKQMNPVDIFKQLHEVFPKVAVLANDADIYVNLEFLSFIESTLNTQSVQIVSGALKGLLENLKCLCSTRETELLYESGGVSRRELDDRLAEMEKEYNAKISEYKALIEEMELRDKESIEQMLKNFNVFGAVVKSVQVTGTGLFRLLSYPFRRESVKPPSQLPGRPSAKQGPTPSKESDVKQSKCFLQ